MVWPHVTHHIPCPGGCGMLADECECADLRNFADPFSGDHVTKDRISRSIREGAMVRPDGTLVGIDDE